MPKPSLSNTLDREPREETLLRRPSYYTLEIDFVSVITYDETETYDENNNNFVSMNLGEFIDSTNDSNGGEEIDDIALCAVQEHNRRENIVLKLARLLNATEEVVAGKIYRLMFEVIESRSEKIYSLLSSVVGNI
ncbi:unnamed protein product [Arabis nemorensis]|uniref:Cysteine proteinase inhibitor n=1 Tax=Arabis nemorensis TaxID=586526 RepID=A0A565CBG1_9BRAS|nr:unnamed protein product [Arabis nemorensis]